MASEAMKTVKKVDNRQKQKAKKPNIFKRFAKYCREVVAELKRVTWPSKKDLISYTAAVIVFVLVVGIIVALLDLGFGTLMRLIVGA
jgi:preprotein translocase subunit SecE